jgi:hypothetical protein
MQTRQLKCALTEDQLKQRGTALEAYVHRLHELETEKKNEAARLKDKIESVELAMARVAVEISERAEYRDVEVTREKDFARNVEEVIRQDTGEIIETRVLQPQERQGELKILRTEEDAEAAQ